MKFRFEWKKALSLVLVLITVMTVFVPAVRIESRAAEPTVNVPVSTVQVSKMHAKFTKLGTMFRIATIAVRGVGSIWYAAENNDGTVTDFAKLALAYFSGNASENEQITDLKDTMIEQFELTRKEIQELRTEIQALQTDVRNLEQSLENQAEYIYLRTALDQFYTEFFSSAYYDLELAYTSVIETLNDPYTNDATIRAKMDDLYLKAYKMRTLQSYITGEIRFDDKSIADLYYEYMMRVNNASPENAEEYEEILTKCESFTLRLFAADAFQKYCLAYASSYQLNYVYDHIDEMLASGAFVGYEVSGTLDGFSNKFTVSEIKRNIAQAKEGTSIVSGKILANLTRMYFLNIYVGYTEDGAQYYAPVSANTVSAYPNATYQMFTVPDELTALFEHTFSFISDNPNVAEVTDTGLIKIKGGTDSSARISYVYGADTLSKPIELYTLEFKVTDRVWSGGYGTTEAPYLISTAEEFVSFTNNSDYWNSDTNVRLIADLDLSGYSLGTVSTFYGVFDGAEHTIKNISRSSAIFAQNAGLIQNLTVDTISVSHRGSGDKTIGGIADTNSGTILNCHIKNAELYLYRHNVKNSSTVYTSFSAILGGIAGTNANGALIESCSVIGTSIKAEASTKEIYEAGGLIDNDDVTSYLTSYLGGIAGSSAGTVNDCFVSDISLKSTTYAAYYKWAVLWEHTYNRVHAIVRNGSIIGENTGSYNNNRYKNVSNPDPVVTEINAKHVADGFVTKNVKSGVSGDEAYETVRPPYISGISVFSLPFQTSFREDAIPNLAGLELIDNHQLPIYGYRIESVDTSARGEKTVTVSYRGLSTTFSVQVTCKHRSYQYVAEQAPTCLANGFTAGILCNDCNTFINGHEVIPNELGNYCKDNNKDHRCDLCEKTLSQCEDKDRDHTCNICGTTVGKHEAAYGKHTCDYCGNVVTFCTDGNRDHLCDGCFKLLSSCTDDNKDHLCDVCGKRLTSCDDGNQDHICDLCSTVLSSCTDKDLNHVCDICGATVGKHEAAYGKHSCDYCGAILSTCADANRDHLCDICFATLSSCTDVDQNHVCELCGKKTSSCADGNSDHICDTCGKTVSPCTDVNRDHLCDVCHTVLSSCADGNRDHLCDVCNIRISNCSDTNKDHLCDICGVTVSGHRPISGSHTCADCGLRMSDCLDINKNHLCDVCNAPVGVHQPANGSHICGHCGVQITSCADLDHNHTCDICGTVLSSCADADSNHICDLCSKKLSEHTDADGNNVCDLCGEQMTPPAPPADLENPSASEDPSTDSKKGSGGCNATLSGSAISFVALTLSAAWLTLRKKKI